MRILVAALLLLAGPQQEANFESAEYGIRLKIPAGWNVDASRERVILKLTLPSDGPVKPELKVYEVALPEPTTLDQYKEPYRQTLQRAMKEPRLVDDRSVQVAGRNGFVFTLVLEDPPQPDQVHVKGVWILGPKRLLAVDAFFPKAQESALAKTYDALIASIEFMPRKEPLGAPEGVKLLGQVLAKLPPPPDYLKQDEELEIAFGEKVIGSHAVKLAHAKREEKPGLEFTVVTKIDLGPDGRIETRMAGFLSNDFSLQVTDLSETKVGKDRRAQYLTAQATLTGPNLVVTRRINGELSEMKRTLPERCILGELSEALLVRLLEAGKSQVVVPTIAGFDNELSWQKIEGAGMNQMKVGERIVDVHVAFLVREDGSLMTYWYDSERRLMRLTTGGQSVVIRRKGK